MANGSKNRRDLNEPEILETAKALGGAWFEWPPLDGWLWHAKTGWIPVEIKQPRRKGKANEFTPAQLRFFEWCKANSARHLIWYTVTDVERDLGARRAA